MSNTYKCPITSFTLTSSQASLECTIPSNPDGKTEGGSNMDGEYDFYIHISTYNYDYVSRYKENNAEVASFAYAGLQTKKRNNTDYVFTKMQDMTSSICKNTNMWNNQTGSSARIYDYNGQDGNNPLLSAGTDTLGISTFALTDTRDSKEYLVRRLADGNCWMVENLNIALASFENTSLLTSENTDLNSKDTWNPLNGADSSSTPQYTVINNKAYYNWYAVTAGSGKYDMTGYTAQDSICPKGWYLPQPISPSAEQRPGQRFLLWNIYRIGEPQDTNTHIEIAERLPISFTHDWGSTLDFVNVDNNTTEWWSGDVYSYGRAWTLWISDRYFRFGAGRDSMSDGYTTRCVAR